MPVHRRWLVLVFCLLSLLCCASFLAAVLPGFPGDSQLWELKEAAWADGSMTIEEFAAYDKMARQDTKDNSRVLMLVAGGCVAVMFMLLPVWAYTEPPLAGDAKARVRK